MSEKEIYISYSSINDFLKCPSLYYYRYQYRNPKTGYRLALANPHLTLGIVFDEVRSLLNQENKEFRNMDLALKHYERIWHIWYKAFGFESPEQEEEFKSRGEGIVKRFASHPHFLLNQTYGDRFLKTPRDKFPNVYLCGNADWLEKTLDSTLILVDFKTGTREEKEDSLQLPIYKFLAESRFNLPVTKTYYWYLNKEDEPKEVFLNSYEKNIQEFLTKADLLYSAIQESKYSCSSGGECCSFCDPYLKIKQNLASHVFTHHRWKKDFFST